MKMSAEKPKRIAFAGTPEFAAAALRALLQAGFDLPLVLTQPDRRAGRGMKLRASAVKQLALEQGLQVIQPRSLRLDGKYGDEARAAQEALQAPQIDVMVVAAYGLILPPWVLDLPRYGCINIHASLLPRWRGAAPIQRAIEAGDAQTGISIMQMDAGLDTGDVLLTQALPIAANDNAASLHDKLAALGGALMVQALTQWSPAALMPMPQDEQKVTYAHKIEKSEAVIDWSLPATTLAQRVRAFNPFPGCSAKVQGQTVKIWQAEAHMHAPAGPPGQILQADARGVLVACGQNALCLQQLQRAGGKRLAAEDFLSGFALQTGQFFEAAT